jgi:hypothetical protein
MAMLSVYVDRIGGADLGPILVERNEVPSPGDLLDVITPRGALVYCRVRTIEPVPDAQRDAVGFNATVRGDEIPTEQTGQRSRP